MTEEHLHAPTGAYALNAPARRRAGGVRAAPAGLLGVRPGGTGADRHRRPARCRRRRRAAARHEGAGDGPRRDRPPTAAARGARGARPGGPARGRPRPRLCWPRASRRRPRSAGRRSGSTGGPAGGAAAEEARRAGHDAMARVLAAPDARTASGTVDGDARATVVVSRPSDRAVFLGVRAAGAAGGPHVPAVVRGRRRRHAPGGAAARRRRPRHGRARWAPRRAWASAWNRRAVRRSPPRTPGRDGAAVLTPGTVTAKPVLTLPSEGGNPPDGGLRIRDVSSPRRSPRPRSPAPAPRHPPGAPGAGGGRRPGGGVRWPRCGPNRPQRWSARSRPRHCCRRRGRGTVRRRR